MGVQVIRDAFLSALLQVAIALAVVTLLSLN
jgi:hypothetical protein